MTPAARRAPLLAAALLSLAAAALAQAPPATDVWIADLGREGGAWTLAAPRNLTDRDGHDNQPAFTADGRTILYTSFLDGQTNVHAIDLASGAVRRRTATPESGRLAPAPPTVERDYAWTPDGALLAFVGSKLHRLRPGLDTEWVEIADLAPFGVRSATRLAVSPDGARLAFVADR
jgi:Tol biopolymer transport system component